jgi:hypothetical protein
MSKKFTIGVNRAVGVKKQGSDLCITIAEQGTRAGSVSVF